MSDARWRTVRNQVAGLEADEGFSGVVRVTKGEQVLLESCHGLADRAQGTPVHVGTRFGTASLSKAFTAVGVLDAVGRGEVALQDRVVDVLPEASRPSTLRPDVTVEHLITHTAGLADYAEEDEDLPGFVEDYATIWTELPSYRVRDDLDILPLFADLPPVCPPGTAFHYSNAGYVLLGILLAHVSGLPFAEAMTRRVLEPAGMTRSGYLALDEAHPDVATGHRRPLTPGAPWRTNIFSIPAVGGGDGGAFVTVGDVERFLRGVHRGGVWRGVRPTDVLTPRVRVDEDTSAGCGVLVRDDGVFGKAGGDPGVCAIARCRPATDTTLVLLGNVGWEDVEGLGDLVDALDAAAFPAT
ncbi:serine hydrolase domain-containing protein [Ornithinimicrobium flavum]|uniref:serine hydrolase domain-containing protein n=1 Tax=Ornithinimicrobium flavum TaxID=1288636 RepID=UPI00106F155D|nr:serine hydrolase domain-containing protein [Ornithinimicrobium flavum]